MTDEGSAYLSVADAFDMKHILCALHFREKAMKAGKGLGGDRFRHFRQAVNKALYREFDSNATLDAFIITQLERHQDHPKSAKFWESLLRNKTKVCFQHTQSHFTAGHVSTSRGESSNARFKGNGALKKELASSDLVRGIERVMSIVSRQDTESIDLLSGLITAQKPCSEYVHKLWMQSVVRASRYHCVIETSTNGRRVFRVGRSEIETDHQLTVEIPTHTSPTEDFPKCTCGFFKSTLIPCGHICAVYHRIPDTLWVATNLAPRWRLQNHPLWSLAHETLHIVPPARNGNRKSPSNVNEVPATLRSDDYRREVSAKVMAVSAQMHTSH
jgi:hypothetical protein